MSPFDSSSLLVQERGGALVDLARRLAASRAQAVLAGSVDLFEDPLFNPAVALLAGEHEDGDKSALHARLDLVLAVPLERCVIERFFEDEWLCTSDIGPHWVALRLDVGEAGSLDYGEAYCVVNVSSHDVYWLDPDGCWG